MLLSFQSSVPADTVEGSFGIATLLGRSVAVMIPRDGYGHGWVSVCMCVFFVRVWECMRVSECKWESVCMCVLGGGRVGEAKQKHRPTLHTPTFSRPSNSVWDVAAWALWSLSVWASYRSTLLQTRRSSYWPVFVLHGGLTTKQMSFMASQHITPVALPDLTRPILTALY